LFDRAFLVSMVEKKANWMQQQQFINTSKLARHVLATILPIIRSIRLYNAA